MVYKMEPILTKPHNLMGELELEIQGESMYVKCFPPVLTTSLEEETSDALGIPISLSLPLISTYQVSLGP